MDSKKAMGEFRQLTGITPKIDGILSVASGKLSVDFCELDKQFARKDPDYDDRKCLYKGESVSMLEYIEKKWGKKAVELIKIML